MGAGFAISPWVLALALLLPAPPHARAGSRTASVCAGVSTLRDFEAELFPSSERFKGKKRPPAPSASPGSCCLLIVCRAVTLLAKKIRYKTFNFHVIQVLQDL